MRDVNEKTNINDIAEKLEKLLKEDKFLEIRKEVENYYARHHSGCDSKSASMKR
jgi:guanylate kinase